MFPLERDEELTVKANSTAGVYMTAGCQKELGAGYLGAEKKIALLLAAAAPVLQTT